MKKLAILALLFSAPLAQADAVADELLSAQAAYRAALKEQNNRAGRIASLQSGISAAQSRIRQAEADIARMQGELQDETAKKAQSASTLEHASRRLDAAWQASRDARAKQ